MDREEAIEKVKDMRDFIIREHAPNDVWVSHMNEAIKVLSEKPRGEWISCSERLPKRDELVLISYRGEVHFCKYLDDGSENAWWSYNYDCCVWNEEVIAWMPLPEPYKKEGDEK